MDLSYTKITDKGAEYIAWALKTNRSLQTLDISHNQISDKGFACITKLQTNTTLSLLKSHQIVAATDITDTANTSL